jgi:hypothetical protein
MTVLLGHDASSLGNLFPTFRSNIVPSCQGSREERIMPLIGQINPVPTPRKLAFPQD